MGEGFQLSAKDLGSIALDNYCQRCFWLKRQLHNKLPWKVFPSIFSKIDSFTKRLVKTHEQIYGYLPRWLDPIGGLSNFIEPPTHHTFRTLDTATNITLTGSADAIFGRKDKSIVIADFKTAKFGFDPLERMYAVQLTTYAYLAACCGLPPVSALWLVYTTPDTELEGEALASNVTGDGFTFPYKVNLKEVGIEMSLIPMCLAEARKIYDLTTWPDCRPGYRDCEQLSGVLNLVSTLEGLNTTQGAEAVKAVANLIEPVLV